MMNDDSELEAEGRALLRALRKRDILLARKSLLHFILQMRPGFLVNFHHFLICERLSSLLETPGQRLIITVPPQYGKSEIVSRYLTPWILGNVPDGKVILASYAASLAVGFNRDVQRIMESPAYRRIFPHTHISPFAPRLKRSEETTETSRGGYLYTVGVGGATTGRTANPLFIVDDPFKDLQQAMSESYREQVQNWFSSVAQTRLSLNASCIIMHTRWHEDDLAGHLLSKAKKDSGATQWDVLNFPAVADEPSELHPEDPRLKGEALWPDMKGDEDEMERIKIDVGSQIWSSVYQQRPRSEGGNMVDAKWWQYYARLPDMEDFEEILISLDCAFKDLKTSDFVVLEVWGRIGSRKYLIDLNRGKWNVIKTCEFLIQFALKYPRAHTKLIEDKANGPAVIQLLEEKMSGILAWEPKGSKISRVTAVSPQIEGKNVYLPHESIAPWVADFVDEWSQFPKGGHDDMVDAGTQALERLSRGENNYLRKLLRKE